MNEGQEKIYNELISKYNFNKTQKEEIKLGLKKNLDVNWYARPEFNDRQMEEIREGLEQDLDVSLYAEPEFDHLQMRFIKEGLEKELRCFYLC